MKLSLQDLEVCQMDREIQLDSARAAGKTKGNSSPGPDFLPRTLRSFVDEDGVARLKKSITDGIDQVQLAQKDLREEVAAMTSSISSLKSDDLKSRSVSARAKLEQAHNQTNIIASDAHEMAMLLESLARHYDQCKQAYELSQKVKNGHYTADMSEELEELADVLNNDARELDGVLTELYERRGSIANSAEYVVQFLNEVKEDHLIAISFFEKFHSFGETELREYQSKMTEFSTVQSENLDHVSAVLLPEMSSLVEYYRLFLQSYNSMVLEISRRRNFQTRLEALQVEMQRKVDKVINGMFVCFCTGCILFVTLTLTYPH